MSVFILGLVLFFAVHSIRIFANGWRAQQVERLGEGRWKLLYALASLAGFGLLVWGFGGARSQSPVLWNPPVALRHLTAAITLLAFVLLAAAYVPGNRIRAYVGHPMLLGTMLWAFAHLLSNGTLAQVLLFGAFLLWSSSAFAAARSRDQASGKTTRALGLARDGLAVGAGAAAWIFFAGWGHFWLIGVGPFD